MELQRVLEIALGNASAALVLAVVVALTGVWLRRPAVLHLLWLVVLARLLAPPVLEIPLLPAPEAVGPPGLVAARTAVVAGQVAPGRGLDASPGFDLRGALLLSWLVGSAALLVLAVVRTLRLIRCIRTGERPTAVLRDRVAELAREMAVRAPELRLVAGQLPPMLWGLPSRPILVLPQGLLATLGPGELDAVLAHELAHLRRRDHWVRFLELAAVVLFWWNPASWWASGGLRGAEEECCDALVAQRRPGSSGAYARGLVKTMGFLAGSDTLFPAVVTGASHFQHLERRIRVIMTGGFARSVSAPLWAALAVAVVGVLVIAPTMAAGRTSAAGQESVSSGVLTGRSISLAADGAFLNDVLIGFEKTARVTVLIDSDATPRLHTTRVTGEFVDTPWDVVLDELLSQAGLTWTRDGDVVMIHLPREPAPTLPRWSGEPITLELQSADLRAVLSTIARLSGTELEIDPEVEGTVTVSLVDVPWDQALDFILAVNGCSWSSENGVVKVSRAPGQGRVPSAVELPQSPPRPVSTVDGERLFRFVKGGEITEPVRVHAPQPAYTPQARDARIQGAVVLQLVVDADGRVIRTQVVRGLPLGLTESALGTVRGWRFEPATLDGAPVAVEYVVAVRFRLDEPSQLP